ncbi:hypothetical protein GF339_06375 [candidate division KSB3 bacterium]|uniref:Uncharacterized protein n=1 Tax=candidate division KSB3 bacterium TaxID=2044937 RepID=A0A9D5JV17_9BACT|nr:hypothetical protein [candidate division KSB3 bacterium]MBD3324191.1 hypothetical protein [candidate division KSB3 bacterium]
MVSPKSAPFPCPDLLRIEDFYFCRCYARRPQICRDFDFEEFVYCPFGMSTFNLFSPEDDVQLKERIEKGVWLLETLRHRRKKPQV